MAVELPKAFAPSSSGVTLARGFQAAAGCCGIKASGRDDLAIVVSDRPARAAAVFTTNAVKGAPVIVGQRHVAKGRLRGIVCNSGVSNVATGEVGVEHAIQMCRALAEVSDCEAGKILPASTGVIGQRLPIDRIHKGVAKLGDELSRGDEVDQRFARAIMTTDTRPKTACRSVRLGGKTVHIGGCAKGAGMIAPNMATMLAFITTDADISLPLLRAALKAAVNADGSFNRLTIDSDTSTSDTVAVLANGAAGNAPIRTRSSTDYERLAKALREVSCSLAYQIVADGEGATHVIRVAVSGAASGPDAQRVARSIADSPLVKTAVHGHDPNWGRLAMATGKSGAKVDPGRLSIRVNRKLVLHNGQPRRFDAAALSKSMQQPEVGLAIDLGLGRGTCEILTCDLSREYITINADYHT